MQCNVNQSKHDNGRFMRTLTNVSVCKYSFSIKFIAKFFTDKKCFVSSLNSNEIFLTKLNDTSYDLNLQRMRKTP